MPTDPSMMAALAPPVGQISNFVDPPTLMLATVTTSAVALSLMTLFVCMRIFTKVIIVREHRVEDFFCYVAWTGVVSYAGIFIYLEVHGLSRHQWDVSIAMLEGLEYYVNVIYCIYGPTTLSAKLSVLFQIKQIFTTQKKNAVYLVILISGIANTIAYTGLFFSYVFQCWPREAIWNPLVQGRCIDSNQSNLAAGVLNIISDVEALLIPAWCIWHLNIPIKRKLLVFPVFGVGFIACAIGIVGIYFRVLLLYQPDFTWIGSILGCLVVCEMAVIVIVGCCPSLPRLYHYARGNPDGTRKPSNNQNRGTSQKYFANKPTSRFGLHSFNKYMSPGMLRLEPISSYDDEGLYQHGAKSEGDTNFELVGLPGSQRDGIEKTTRIEQSVE